MRTGSGGGRTGRTRCCWLLLFAAIAGALVVPPSAGSAAPCSDRTAAAGIAVVKGCLSSVSTTTGGQVISGVAEGPQDVDLNGFIVRLEQGEKLSVHTERREITTHGSRVQLGSKNWPTSGKVELFPGRFALSFIAPPNGSMALEDLGVPTAVGRFFGDLFSLPFGTLASMPLRLHENGEGSMDITVALRGYFTLKGKEQSVKIRFPTASGKGTRFDGFKFELNEIDALKAITLENLRAEYSAQKQRVGGSATVTFPFSKGGKAQRGPGFGVGFQVEKGALTELSGKVAGVKIPVGSGGFITDIDALIRLRNAQCGPPFNATIGVRGAFEPELRTPLGDIPPVAASSTLGFSTTPQCDTVFKLTGGLEIFRLPVGDASIEIFTSGAIRAGAGLGIGFPSYRNRPDDPFYIGARVGGWFADRKFQLTGAGRVRLARLNLFDGRILLNQRAVGACWTVIGFPGGAVYEYRKRSVETFGVGCGLDRYSEQFPRGASASHSHPRRIRLDRGEVVLHARGRGGPPRFTARSSNGRVYSSPAPGSRPWNRSRDHLFFVNQTGTNTTHLFIRRPRGTWTITPHAGSPPITSLKAGRRAPRERVRAEVRGTGAVRELVWRSRGRRNTRLIFSETLPGGVEVPILNTGREDGRHAFRVVQGHHYGRRRLRVRVQHGFGVTQDAHVDRYAARRPRLLQEPARIRARRNHHNVHVKWTGVRGARGYLVEIDEPGARHRIGLVRVLRAHRRRTIFRGVPGEGRLIARVHTLNTDGRPGRAETRHFATGPSAGTLRGATRESLRSAQRARRFVRIVTHCPELNGHCLFRVELRSRRGRRLGQIRYQQTPDTFSLRHLRPRSRRVRRLLGQGRSPGIRLRIVASRVGIRGRGGRVVASKGL